MKYCHHYVGQNCIDKNIDFTKCPVKNCEQSHDHSSENDDEKLCCSCLLVKPLTVTLNPCCHEMCKDCTDEQTLQNTNDCPLCKEKIVYFENINNEKLCCSCLLEKPLPVTLNPCCHKMCNDCANELTVQNITNCPLCREQIVLFKNIKLIERCACKQELQRVVLQPCHHKIGIACANIISNKKNYQPKCPICSKKVLQFYTDEPHINKSLNPSYLRRMKNVMLYYLNIQK
ncbi:uncharacterized protein LOC126909456 [Daktulosphaira vitifoliae]|uniref:uncharacterized protein LOC126909456 n=1 Tax=Daktulosphaira vitifoliae TaxID=58002 RepID=UPI0021AA5495|nr:uncharacterized protein LOC126909456 [Daktulosphaira vitifoliae]